MVSWSQNIFRRSRHVEFTSFTTALWGEPSKDPAAYKKQSVMICVILSKQTSNDRNNNLSRSYHLISKQTNVSNTTYVLWKCCTSLIVYSLCHALLGAKCCNIPLKNPNPIQQVSIFTSLKYIFKWQGQRLAGRANGSPAGPMARQLLPVPSRLLWRGEEGLALGWQEWRKVNFILLSLEGRLNSEIAVQNSVFVSYHRPAKQ